ncbi:MAG: RHS repeat-associated core domain-containing protein, partial [Planctomycetota bacterium]
FIYGNYIDEVLYTQGTGPANQRYYVHDHLYSPVALVYAGTGTVIERYEYDAYGNPTIWNADFTTERDNSNYGNPYLFTGRRVDIMDSGSLKIQYNRNRYYDYYTGRFTTHDPLAVDVASIPGDAPTTVLQQFGILNLYEYANSRPTNMIDSWGLWGSDVHCTDTTKWANNRALCFAGWIGKWDAGVDKSYWRRPILNSFIGTTLHLLGVPGIIVGTKKLDDVARWHFPGADDGQSVVPGGPLAWREIEKGIKNCNLFEFSEGLHQLQDSFSHQSGGKLPPWRDRVGHSRDRHGWYWEQEDNPEANPIARPWAVRGVQLACLRTLPFWMCGRERVLKASRRAWTFLNPKGDADNPTIFPDAHTETGEETRAAMDKFREKCPCIKDGPFAGECVICQGLAKSED